MNDAGIAAKEWDTDTYNATVQPASKDGIVITYNHLIAADPLINSIIGHIKRKEIIKKYISFQAILRVQR